MLYMVTWIPSIYPIHVSIYTSTMDPSWVTFPISVHLDLVRHHSPEIFSSAMRSLLEELLGKNLLETEDDLLVTWYSGWWFQIAVFHGFPGLQR
jgi:hypothetical protein